MPENEFNFPQIFSGPAPNTVNASVSTNQYAGFATGKLRVRCHFIQNNLQM